MAKPKKHHSDRKGGRKLCIFKSCMLYVENSKEFTKSLQDLISELNEVARHVTNVQNS